MSLTGFTAGSWRIAALATYWFIATSIVSSLVFELSTTRIDYVALTLGISGCVLTGVLWFNYQHTRDK